MTRLYRVQGSSRPPRLDVKTENETAPPPRKERRCQRDARPIAYARTPTARTTRAAPKQAMPAAAATMIASRAMPLPDAEPVPADGNCRVAGAGLVCGIDAGAGAFDAVRFPLDTGSTGDAGASAFGCSASATLLQSSAGPLEPEPESPPSPEKSKLSSGPSARWLSILPGTSRRERPPAG